MKIKTLILEAHGYAFTVDIETHSPAVTAAVVRVLSDLEPAGYDRETVAFAIAALGRSYRGPFALTVSRGGHHVALSVASKRNGADLGRAAVLSSATHPDWK